MEEIIRPLLERYSYEDIVLAYNHINRERYTLVRTKKLALWQLEGNVSDLIEKLSAFPKDSKIWIDYDPNKESDDHVMIKFNDLETDEEYNARIGGMILHELVNNKK